MFLAAASPHADPRAVAVAAWNMLFDGKELPDCTLVELVAILVQRASIPVAIRSA
jgi:hypothetical protein